MMTLKQRLEYYQQTFDAAKKKSEAQVSLLWREHSKRDLYFLMRFVLIGVRYLFVNRTELEEKWFYDRCNEVQANPNGYIDLWAREHGKSSIITFAKTIQDIINDPEITFGFFSHTRPIAKGFLRQVKREMEENEVLKGMCPDIFYQNPSKESPKWSEDDGIIVKRTGNPNAATVEAWGLVDSQPTSKHFKVRVYDDVVVMGSVSTPEMINKTTEAWELSLNLGMDGGWTRYVGTPYHYNDTYITIMNRGAAIPRLHPGTDDGTEEGNPVMWSREYLQQKRQSMGPYTFATQILLNPRRASTEGFMEEWLKYWPAQKYSNLNLYLFCDPANEKSKNSDYTTFFLIGVGADHNYYIVSMLRDRINLVERANILFTWHKLYRPKMVYYEKYGIQTDIQHYESRMNEENYRFKIIPVGGNMPKNDRIKQLIPLFESGRIYLPETCPRVTYDKKQFDLTKVFVNEEYKAFPFPVHDDMLDCLARILDPDVHLAFPDGTSEFIPPIVEDMIKMGLFGDIKTKYDPLDCSAKGYYL